MKQQKEEKLKTKSKINYHHTERRQAEITKMDLVAKKHQLLELEKHHII